MTAPETPDELRARLKEAIDRLCCGPLPNVRGTYDAIDVIVDAWPEIDELLARLTAAEADAAHWRANHDEQVRRKQGTAAFLSIARAHARGLRARLTAAEAENVQLRQLADLFRFNFSPWLIHNAPDLYRAIWGEW